MSGAVAFDLERFLARERERVEEALERTVAALDGVLPPDLAPVAGHAVLTGGKRLRPILCVTAFRATGGEADGAEAALYDLGCSVELIHAYSLMHDDLPCMDDADLRRGRPTSHVVFGEAAAVRAGAALIPAAALQAWASMQGLGRSEAAARAVVSELMRAAGGGALVGGQLLDLVGEGARLDAVQLDRLHRLKTGALLRASLRMGALAAEAHPAALDAVGAYGRAVGLAFQIADDVLDATATAQQLGKNPSDAALDKSTYVSLYGLEEARARAFEEAREAEASLERAGLDSPELVALARYVVERTR